MFAYESYDAPMDLGGEEGAVATCVAGVTSAFENGAAILARIRQRREAAGAPSLPRMLEESVSQAPEEIQRERLRGVVRFGDQFEVGDLRAVVALQQITIQLQNSLVGRLHDIEDGNANVAALTEAADRGRDNTITTLIALRQRLSGQQGSHQEMTRTASDTSTLSMTSPVTPRSPPMHSPPFPPSVALPATRPPRVPPPVPMKPHEHTMSYYEPSSFSPHVEDTRFTYREVDEDQVEIDSAVANRKSISSVYSAQPHPPGISGSPWTAQTAPTGCPESTPHMLSPPRPPSISAFSWTTQGTQGGRSSSSGSAAPSVKTYPLNFTSSNQHPSAQNNYLGFCKAAWKLQCGDDKALNKAKDFTHSVHSKYHFLTCSKFRCEFKGKGPNVLTNRVITDETRGLKYRWSFFAKSHVFMKSATDDQYSYLCMFCVFAGGQQVVMNFTALLDHISLMHRGGVLSDVILDRTYSVQGRVCKDTEKFDMNLFTAEDQAYVPRDAGVYRPFSTGQEGARAELPGRRQSAVAELSARNRSEVVELSARKRSVVEQKVFELHSSP